jgi:hypothetical protein
MLWMLDGLRGTRDDAQAAALHLFQDLQDCSSGSSSSSGTSWKIRIQGAEEGGLDAACLFFICLRVNMFVQGRKNSQPSVVDAVPAGGFCWVAGSRDDAQAAALHLFQDLWRFAAAAAEHQQRSKLPFQTTNQTLLDSTRFRSKASGGALHPETPRLISNLRVPPVPHLLLP